MRSRYFKNATAQKPNFSWLGTPIDPPVLTAKDRKLDPSTHLHYQACQLGDLTVSLGEFVIIKSEDNVDNLVDCDVARLDRLYWDPDNTTDPYRAVVSWMCRPMLLPAHVKAQGHGLEEQGAIPLQDKTEVLGEAREYDNNLSAETIYFKCTVVKGGVEENPSTFTAKFKKKGDKYPVYCHRFDMKMVRKKGKKCYIIDPAFHNPLQPSVAEMADLKPIKSSTSNILPVKIPLTTIGNFNKLNKRRLSSTEIAQSPSKKSKQTVVKTPSPELTSYITDTVQDNFDGGYWGFGEGKRTRKPRKSTDCESLVSINQNIEPVRPRRRSCTSAPATPDRYQKVISTERFTQVETATGSGRKITFKCRNDKKFAPSAGLAGNQIASILGTDEEEKIPTTPKPKTVTRTRRASVSCTTPTRMTITSVVSRPVVRRPASEVKKNVKNNNNKRSISRKTEESSDDDFEPVEPVKKKDSSDEDEDYDDRFVSKKNVKKTPSKTTIDVKKSQEPKTPKRTFKPSVAPRAKPLSGKVNPLTEAQQRLHVSAVPDSLPCREEEFAEIFGYVESKLKEGTGGCYYISGVPGTGKTATVMEVIRYLKDNQEEYPEFNFYQMNGMRLTSPEQAYVEMWRQITGEKATSEHAMKLLDARFNKSAPKRLSTIFLVDELDMLCNKKQSVLYNIFDWPSKPQGKLIVLAIANTMDLPERVMINRVSSRLGLTRQTFQPYTHVQLQAIVASRLEGLAVFQQDAIQLVARKVASLSGDARRALDICRRATEMAEIGGQDKIGVGHVTNAHQEMFSSPKILAIRSCSQYEQMALRVMVSEFHRTGVEETTLGAIFRELTTCLRTEGLGCLSLPGTCSLVARLSAQRLVLAEHFRQGIDTKLRLNVASEDITFALKKMED